jgi:hypothetical protein
MTCTRPSTTWFDRAKAAAGRSTAMPRDLPPLARPAAGAPLPAVAMPAIAAPPADGLRADGPTLAMPAESWWTSHLFWKGVALGLVLAYLLRIALLLSLPLAVPWYDGGAG